jgi:hypothetical protein
MASTYSVDDNVLPDDDLEKSPIPFNNEAQEGLNPITRVLTTPPSPITEIEKGLIAWESQNDPENPL